MNKILLLALLCSAQFANAGPYTDAVNDQEMCEAGGRMGRDAFRVKEAGVSLDKFKINISKLPQRVRDEALQGYNAKDEKSAYMKVWAACMDAL